MKKLNLYSLVIKNRLLLLNALMHPAGAFLLSLSLKVYIIFSIRQQIQISQIIKLLNQLLINELIIKQT